MRRARALGYRAGVPRLPRPRALRRSTWVVTVVGAVVSLAAVCGCRDGDRRVPVIDLVEELPYADVRCEPVALDIGSPQARDSLVRGWYDDERSPRTGRSFAWSRGGRSEIRFHVGRARPLSVTITASPFAAPGLPQHGVRVLVNELEIARIELRRGWQEYTFELPREALHHGSNRLALVFDRVWVPAEVRDGTDDRRRLAMAVDVVRFHGTEVTTGVSRTGRTLSIPAGCAVDWYLDPPAEGSVTLSGVGLVRDGGLVLEATARTDGHDELLLERVSRSQGTVRWELPRRGEPVRLRFEAMGEGSAAPGRSIVVEQPLVTAARTATLRPQQPKVSARGGMGDGSAGPNIVVYLVDALRADHLGCYGAGDDASPRVDAFAAEAVVFEDAVAQSSWTKAAVASIFTGLWPPAHGVHGPHDRLPEDLPTMPELLHAGGYLTAAFVANAYVGRSFGFDRGFEHFEFLKHTVGDSAVIHERVVRWLDRTPSGRPFFLYVHTVDPHAPYAPPDRFRRRFADEVGAPEIGGVSTVRSLARGERVASGRMADDLRALYRAEVAFNDFNFGRLVDELKRRGLFENSLIIFTSDHGEAFGEHGSWTHGLDLYGESLRIPLVLRFPGGAHGGLRVRPTVQQADLLPTVLAAGGVTPPSRLDGTDLSGIMARPVDRAVLCYLDYWGKRGAALLLGRWKLIRPLSEDFGLDVALFDRANDPDERHDLAAELPIRTGYLGTQMKRGLVRGRAPIEVEIDARTRSELEALGYIE